MWFQCSTMVRWWFSLAFRFDLLVWSEEGVRFAAHHEWIMSHQRWDSKEAQNLKKKQTNQTKANESKPKQTKTNQNKSKHSNSKFPSLISTPSYRQLYEQLLPRFRKSDQATSLTLAADVAFFEGPCWVRETKTNRPKPFPNGIHPIIPRNPISIILFCESKRLWVKWNVESNLSSHQALTYLITYLPGPVVSPGTGGETSKRSQDIWGMPTTTM